MDALIASADRPIPFVSAEDRDPALVTFDGYQKGAASTAIYPRVYTEQQVRNICVDFLTRAIGSFNELDAIDVEELLNEHETDFSRLVYPVLGLLGETGELANKLKKVARDGQGMQTNEQTQDIVQELGDVQWYVAAIATETNTSLGLIAFNNLKKLFSRKERGVLGGSGDNR